MIELNCYIQEYETVNGLALRLRDKQTNKKVSIKTTEDKRIQLIEFISKAKINNVVMSTIFNRYGTDVVIVRGKKTREIRTTIYIDLDVPGGKCMYGYIK